MTNIPTSKTTENNSPEKIDFLCRIHLKAESILNTLLVFILALPLLVGIGVYRLVVYIVTNIVSILIWVVGHIIPFIRLLYRGVAYLVSLAIAAIGLITTVAIAIIAWIYRGVLYLVDIINWCAVRSILRMISMVTGSISTLYLVYAVLTIPGDIKIFTGRFYDSNPTVYAIHIAILVLMFAISIYYNAWAYSSDDEIKFVCKRTAGWDRLMCWVKK